MRIAEYLAVTLLAIVLAFFLFGEISNSIISQADQAAERIKKAGR